MVIINSKLIFVYILQTLGQVLEVKRLRNVSAWMGLQYICGTPSFLSMTSLSWTYLCEVPYFLLYGVSQLVSRLLFFPYSASLQIDRHPLLPRLTRFD